MSVVGIDFGNLNTVVAVARNRGIDVIVNEVSNRATPSLVSFGEKQRYLGEMAKTQELFNFKNTVSSLKRLIGRPYSDPEIQQVEKKFVNANLVEGERGEVAASVWFQNDQRTFSLTQITGMFFGKVKEFTSAELKIPVTDVVISCPTWFTDRQRRAILDAAQIQNLNVLRIMNDTTASALGYGITKTDLPEATAKPRNVVFVDIGHSSYQVAVVSFVKGKLIVKGTAFDRNFGGRDFDEVLAQRFIQEFNAKYKMDIASSAKATFRLRQACERVKKTLSANAIAQLNVECLLDDKDVSANVQRADFEEWVGPILSRLLGPLEAALAAAGIAKEDVDFVELIGGSTRIPAIKSALAKFFGGNDEGKVGLVTPVRPTFPKTVIYLLVNKLSTTLNQDEAVARGCALQCAILSPVFKVRDFSVQDWNTYPIELSWDPSLAPAPKAGEAAETKMDAFPVGNAVQSTKILTFYRTLKDSEINATQDRSVSLAVSGDYGEGAVQRGFPVGCGKHIGQWTLNGIKRVQSSGEGDAKATIKIKAKLDYSHVLSVESASQIEELVVPVEEEKKEEKKEEEKKEEATPMETDENPGTPEANGKPATPPPAGAKTKKVIKKHDLTITAETFSASLPLLTKWQQAEGEMQSMDRLIMDTAEARNALEEYVYETRSKLEMAWTEYVTDSDRSAIMKACNDMEEWLYGEGEEQTKSVYIEKLQELRKLGDPIKRRYLEAEERPAAVKRFRDYVNSVIVSVTAADERYAHISKEELDKVLKECQSKLDWLNNAVAKINEAPKHVDPPVTVAEINRQLDLLQLFVNPILNRPKPAPKKEEPKKEETGKKEDAKPEEKKAEEAEKPAEDMEVD
ncbi:adenyl-nucleotide exchange factor sse1 [Borealophlyctis nickersoniae]|nr:adenyl-nucleotide exchange factor sse1 [Borealophlyctis nickersoniae]